MPDTAKPAAEADADKPATPPRRHPGHRGQDVRDTVAEMAAKAAPKPAAAKKPAKAQKAAPAKKPAAKKAAPKK